MDLIIWRSLVLRQSIFGRRKFSALEMLLNNPTTLVIYTFKNFYKMFQLLSQVFLNIKPYHGTFLSGYQKYVKVRTSPFHSFMVYTNRNLVYNAQLDTNFIFLPEDTRYCAIHSTSISKSVMPVCQIVLRNVTITYTF